MLSDLGMSRRVPPSGREHKGCALVSKTYWTGGWERKRYTFTCQKKISAFFSGIVRARYKRDEKNLSLQRQSFGGSLVDSYLRGGVLLVSVIRASH